MIFSVENTTKIKRLKNINERIKQEKIKENK